MSVKTFESLSRLAREAIVVIFDSVRQQIFMLTTNPQKDDFRGLASIWYEDCDKVSVVRALDASGMHYYSSDGPEGFTVFRIIHLTPNYARATPSAEQPSKPSLEEVLRQNFVMAIADPHRNRVTVWTEPGSFREGPAKTREVRQFEGCSLRALEDSLNLLELPFTKTQLARGLEMVTRMALPSVT